MNFGRYILKPDGQAEPCEDLLTWGRWIEANRSKWHLLTGAGGYEVSTIFLGLDHNFSQQGEPVLFETMVFARSKDSKGELLDAYRERHHTWYEAKAHHFALAEAIEKGDVFLIGYNSPENSRKREKRAKRIQQKMRLNPLKIVK